MSLTILSTTHRQSLAAIPSLALVVALPAMLLDRANDVRQSLRIIDVGVALDVDGAEIRRDALQRGLVLAPSVGNGAGPFCRLIDDADAETSAGVRAYALCAADAETPHRRCDTSGFAPSPVAMEPPGSSTEGVLTYILDGDLHIESRRTLAFELTGLVGRDVNLVVMGDVFIADDVYVDDGKLRIYALKDHKRGTGGDIVLGDADFGSLAHVEADLVAAGRILRLPGADEVSVGRVAVEGVPLTLR
jgi:hypothetical protein